MLKKKKKLLARTKTNVFFLKKNPRKNLINARTPERKRVTG